MIIVGGAASAGGGSAVLGPIIVAIIALATAVLAAITAAYLGRELKISEFRQTWIDSLRVDIADFIGCCFRWRSYDETKDSDKLTPKEVETIRDEMFKEHHGARVILNRIRMRFNPDPKNIHFGEDEAFLKQLSQLLENQSSGVDQVSSEEWVATTDAAVLKAREILKREWEVTKRWPLLLRR